MEASSDKKSSTLFPHQKPAYFADIIVPLFLPQTLTWSIPNEWVGKVQVGCRVEVQLGKTRHYAGIVKRVHKELPSLYEVKPILNILDNTPVVFEKQLNLWKWIADYYLSTEGEVMIAALPSHLKLSSESIIQYNEHHTVFLPDLETPEYLLAEALEIRKELKPGEIQQLLDTHNIYPTIKKLVDKGVALVWEALADKYKEKTETYVLLAEPYHQEQALEALINEWGKAPRQLDLLLAYLHYERTEGQVTKAVLLKKSGASSTVLNQLLAKNILRLEKRAIDRLPMAARNISINFELSDAQETALQSLKQAFLSKPVCLLHGVTGSGKTLLYIKLLAEEIKQGKQCLYLLPEIALTSQIIRKLREHLGGHVGIYHSKFNANERLELWNKVKTGEIQVVLGARSALFLPFSNLSLIIIDEEHDSSFKQMEPPPRYHARDAAIYYASLNGARVLLGSATPSLETYRNCETGKFGLVNLNERFGGIELPELQWIDPKPFRQKGVQLVLTPPMISAMAETIKLDKQVIVFQNRRGYTPFQVCLSCGWIPKCEHCDVSLNYHKASQKLHCHYCGTTYPIVKTCSACGSTHFRQQQFGTEKLEEALDEALPMATIARMDTDSIRGKHSHETLIKQFEEQRIQVLAGTQMVVKGLDFDHVGLVAIPDADGILNFTDFRVNERAFQLIEQVSGRAGRKNEKGKVLIQLQQTEHPLIPFLQAHNYEAFYNWELENRKHFFYPPFSRMIAIQCKHREQLVAWRANEILATWLRQQFSQYVIGPAEPPVNRVRNLYIYELMLKLPRNNEILSAAKKYIREGIVELLHQPDYKRVFVSIDVDPL